MTIINRGVCYVQNFKLPKDILSLYLNDKNIYNVLFLLGCAKNNNRALIINSNQNDVNDIAYYWKLLPFTNLFYIQKNMVYLKYLNLITNQQ